METITPKTKAMYLPLIAIGFLIYLIGYRQGKRNKKRVEDGFCEKITEDKELMWKENFHNQYRILMEHKN